jgi:hypothetical protein
MRHFRQCHHPTKYEVATAIFQLEIRTKKQNNLPNTHLTSNPNGSARSGASLILPQTSNPSPYLEADKLS